jgi:GT2 family glycosyltransferase
MKLSIIIVSYNTKEITKNCLSYLQKNFKKYPLENEIIVVDNNSTDGSLAMLESEKRKFNNLRIISLNKNLGYGKANNIGIKEAKGDFILLLNSDVYVKDLDFLDLINLFGAFNNLGALTVKVKLNNNLIDPASHRGLPTLWRSFNYFLNLEKLTQRIFLLNRLFGGYHLTYYNLEKIHPVEVISGAFFFTRRDILVKVGGFDEDYFLYGEDVDLCYKIKEMRYDILYYPLWEVIHIKSVSGLKNKDFLKKLNSTFHFFNAMKIFYQKHYQSKYPFFTNWLVNKILDYKIKNIENQLLKLNHGQ